MFKIHDDKVYFVAETPDINKVIEIFLPKDDRGTIMDSHEIRVDLCRAVIHMEKKGVRVLKVRNICLSPFWGKKQVVAEAVLSRSVPLKQKLRSLTIPTIVLPRKNCPSVLLNFLTEPLSKEICIPHSFYYILGRTFNPITRKPLKKISRSLRCCTTKQKNACKTATSGCLVALASKAPII